MLHSRKESGIPEQPEFGTTLDRFVEDSALQVSSWEQRRIVEAEETTITTAESTPVVIKQSLGEPKIELARPLRPAVAEERVAREKVGAETDPLPAEPLPFGPDVLEARPAEVEHYSEATFEWEEETEVRLMPPASVLEIGWVAYADGAEVQTTTEAVPLSGLSEPSYETSEDSSLWEQVDEAESAQLDGTNTVRLLVEQFEKVDAGDAEAIGALIDEIIEMADSGLETEATALKERALQELCEELFASLGINQDETAVQEFMHVILSSQGWHEIEESVEEAIIDEGTHERKLDVQVLLKLLAQASRPSDPPTVRLGRLAVRRKLFTPRPHTTSFRAAKHLLPASLTTA